MKVIFLDNDGVICLSNNWGSRLKKQKNWGGSEIPIEYRFDNFDEKAVKVLNEILEQTGAEIVVSSDWRFHASIDELGDYYESQGIIKRPIGGTENFKDIFPSEWKRLRFRADLELERSMEINHWIKNHPEVTHWVAIDDLDISVDYLNKVFTFKDDSDLKPGVVNFVHTPISNEGIKQTGVKEKVLNFLQ